MHLSRGHHMKDRPPPPSSSRRRLARRAGLLLLVGLAGCPSPGFQHIEEGALAFVAPYALRRSMRCDGNFEVSYDGSDYRVLGSYPHFSRWELRVCGERLKFPMDCSGRCWAHAWPVPREMATGDHEDPFVEELSTAIHAVPTCLDDDGHAFLLKRIVPQPNVVRYEIQRCGTVRRVAVTCNRVMPYACSARDTP